VLLVARCKYRTQKNAKNCHLGTIAQLHRAISSQLRHVSTIEKKKLVKQHTSSTCAYSMVNFGPLVAEILSLVWGTPAISRGFAFWIRYCSDVAQRKSTKLHDVWPSPGLVHYIYIGLVHYIYIFGISCPLTEFCHVQNSLCVHLHTIAQLCRAISLQLRHLSTIGKKLTKQQYVLQMSSQYAELQLTNG